MSSYFVATMDGSELDGKTIELNAGGIVATISATAGVRYGNPVTGGTGINTILGLVKAALDTATGDTWTLAYVQQANPALWKLEMTQDSGGSYDLESTGTFDLSLIGVSPASLPVPITGTASPFPWMPWGVWWYNPGAIHRRRKRYAATVTSMLDGSMEARRGPAFYEWYLKFSAVRGAHIYDSDLAAVPLSLPGADAADPNVTFESAVWDLVEDYQINFILDDNVGTAYLINIYEESFLEDLKFGTQDLTEMPLAILDLEFRATEVA